MKSRLASTLTCLLALSGAACSDDSDGPTRPVGDGSVAVPDSGGGTRPDAGSDAGPLPGTPDSGPPATLTLVQYVDDLIDKHTDDTSLPDDVAAKTFTDTDDPAAFDKRFQ